MQITTASTAQTVTLPSVGGFSGTVLIPADTEDPGTVLTLTASTVVPTGLQNRARSAMAARRVPFASIYSPLLYLTMNAGAASQLYSQPGYNIDLPTNMSTAGMAFYLSVFDPANSSSNYLIGPATVSGGTVSFQTGSTALTFTSGETYAFELFEIPGTSPTPNPSTSPSNIHEFSIANSPNIMNLTNGPDGNVWFVGQTDKAGPITTVIGSITTSGVVTQYTESGQGGEIITGPDHRLWFTEQSTSIGAATTSGTISIYSAAALDNGVLGVQTFGLTIGPDQNVWVTDSDNNQIIKFSTQGSILGSYPLSGFALGIPGRGAPLGIADGPDGALWIAQDISTSQTTPQIVRLTTAGAITFFTISQRPYQIIAGQDGNLWYSESFGNGIARITPTGTVTEFQASVGAAVYGITSAADGSFWSTELAGNAIDHFSLTGVLLNRYPLPTPNSGPIGVTIGPDGNVWFAEQAGRIGVLTP